MAYDLGLAQRVRELLEEIPGYEEKMMFGGLGFLLYGNMACGILRDDLIVRVGPAAYAGALRRRHVHQFDITGRAMKGWVTIAPDGFERDADLAGWVNQGADFARTLPPK